MSSQEQVSTLLHYSFWRNGHGHFSRILNCDWFFSKSPHCQCPKITFELLFSWFLHSGSSHQLHYWKKTKSNMVSWNNLMTSALFKSYLAYFCHLGKFLIFFVFHVTLSVLMLMKWNFTVIWSWRVYHIDHPQLLSVISLASGMCQKWQKHCETMHTKGSWFRN